MDLNHIIMQAYLVHGPNVKKISEVCELGDTTVLSHLRELGLTKFNPSKTAQQILEERKTGLSQQQIADKLGITQGHVSRTLRMYKIPCNQIQLESEERYRLFAKLGKHQQKAADLFCKERGLTPLWVLKSNLEFLLGLDINPGIMVTKLDILTYDPKLVRDRFENLAALGGRKWAKKVVRKSVSPLMYDTETIEDKMRVYVQNDINFLLDTTLLEKDPLKVLETREHLHNSLYYFPDQGTPYYRLLIINLETLLKKENECERLGIEFWRDPEILRYGFGPDQYIHRKIRFIEKNKLPVDYLRNPGVLIKSEEAIIYGVFVKCFMPFGEKIAKSAARKVNKYLRS